MLRDRLKNKGILIIIALIPRVLMAHSAVAENENLNWIDVKKNDTLRINGLPWFEENQKEFYRLPYLRKEISELNPYARQYLKCPSGARVRFKTDSTVLKLKITHGMEEAAKLYLANLSTISAGGIDLYIGAPDQMSFWMTTEPLDPRREYEHLYFQNEPRQMRELTLYLPTYSELAELKIGVDPHSSILAPTPCKIRKPIVFYGTSITQGASSSRGSNGYVPIVGRRLNADVVNLGFSSGGCGEEAMADLMAEIDASVYVVDSVANMDEALMTRRYAAFVQILREKRPDIPVVLMTKIHFAKEIAPDSDRMYEHLHRPLFETYRKLKDQGDDNVYLFDSGKVIRPGGDHPTIDGVHLTDLGFKMIADELVPLLREIIGN